MENATATNIYNVIKQFFDSHKIPYIKNCVGFAADGANAMMGKNNSLKTHLLQDIPHLFTFKCICHSLALCANNACSKLPESIEKVTLEVFNYMRQSFKRQKEFQSFQIFYDLKPHKLLQPSQTRWLSLVSVVNRLL